MKSMIFLLLFISQSIFAQEILLAQFVGTNGKSNFVHGLKQYEDGLLRTGILIHSKPSGNSLQNFLACLNDFQTALSNIPEEELHQIGVSKQLINERIFELNFKKEELRNNESQVTLMWHKNKRIGDLYQKVSSDPNWLNKQCMGINRLTGNHEFNFYNLLQLQKYILNQTAFIESEKFILMNQLLYQHNQSGIPRG